ncbi:MAG: hypothetical protein JWL86_4840 [Rhizobium sp.]|nr:hypothetical protein [Rhizobium sp.]
MPVAIGTPPEPLAPSSPQRGEGGPKGRMRGSRSAKAVPGVPLIASHALGTSPRWGEEGASRCAVASYPVALLLKGRCHEVTEGGEFTTRERAHG